MQFVFTYIPTSSKKEAEKIGRILIKEKLAGCVNILDGVTSIFPWENKIQKTKEVVLLVKTKKSLVSKVSKRVEELHSYDCPCIAVLPVDFASRDYEKWLKKEIR